MGRQQRTGPGSSASTARTGGFSCLIGRRPCRALLRRGLTTASGQRWAGPQPVQIPSPQAPAAPVLAWRLRVLVDCRCCALFGQHRRAVRAHWLHWALHQARPLRGAGPASLAVPVLAGLRRAVPRMAAGPNLAPTRPPGAPGVSAPRPRRWRCRATGSARATASPFTPTSSTRGPTRRLSCRRRTPQDATAAGSTCRRRLTACGAAQRALLLARDASTRGCSDGGAASCACRRPERPSARGSCAGWPRPGIPRVCKSGSDRLR